MSEVLHIRRAGSPDAGFIAEANRAMALETEGKRLFADRVAAGVAHLIATPALGFYVVAERAGEPVGCLLVTTEWSDWRNGLFWWIQSVYVVPAARRQGVYRALYDFVREQAREQPGICGFRLYVEKDNRNAQRTYRSLGMAETDYLIYEEMQPGLVYYT